MNKYKNIKIFIGESLYNEYKLKVLNNNIFEYVDDSCHNTIEFFSDYVKLIRENEEFLIEITSNKEEALYRLKELNYELDIKVNYFDIINEDKDLILCYQLETNDKQVKLILEGE